MLGRPRGGHRRICSYPPPHSVEATCSCSSPWLAGGLLPEDVVPALGLVVALVLDEAGECFDGFTVTAPERLPEPLALALGGVGVELDLAL